ncbi:hypothetical protein [Phenylobacterium sp.]|uniref:hypothetical protein n=1 Tax=Phenylobacterium sp. TaxID=1871053 RepID=UPI0025D0764C|nr:hypothetical protein [Phenylobacterium sp.]
MPFDVDSPRAFAAPQGEEIARSCAAAPTWPHAAHDPPTAARGHGLNRRGMLAMDRST